MIYQIFYLKSGSSNRRYLSVLDELNKIKKKFQEKNYGFGSNYYEKNIMRLIVIVCLTIKLYKV